ncbi:hypothetical protein JYU29_03495 [Tianweitania sp. BSSL-BM11]|uniref:DUF4148 domain-containing protein n=1 Tax=Tianweitania aestuarii TaxID=2814886 RepID=A0ABS5RRR5_9HYPH|nr:hypothetical protein [Tianweitania aestuarii]MBS9719748.1 hypothetical protein [Tianweitania aestuarii]
MKKIVLSAVAVLIASTMPGLAQTHHTQSREYRQGHRIERGIARGELTPRELRQIQRQQRRIDRSQHRAARDGYITPAERRRLERQQNRASRNIHRKTHNNRTM